MSERLKLDAAFLAGYITGTHDIKGDADLPAIIKPYVDRVMAAADSLPTARHITATEVLERQGVKAESPRAAAIKNLATAIVDASKTAPAHDDARLSAKSLDENKSYDSLEELTEGGIQPKKRAYKNAWTDEEIMKIDRLMDEGVPLSPPSDETMKEFPDRTAGAVSAQYYLRARARGMGTKRKTRHESDAPEMNFGDNTPAPDQRGPIVDEHEDEEQENDPGN